MVIFTLLAIPLVLFVGCSIGIGISFWIADLLVGSADVGFRWLVGNAVGAAFAVTWVLTLAVVCFIWIVSVTT